jgi:hypothetical protein
MRRPDPPTTGDPPLLTILAMVVAAEATGAAVWLVLAGQRLLGGFAALVASIVMVGVTPVVAAGRARFAERILDRLFDACLLAAVAWVWRTIDPAVSVLALVGIALSYLAGYERARGEALGFRGSETVAYRAARQALIVLALVSGWMHVALGALVAVTAFAAAVRASNVAAQERRRQLAHWGTTR